MNNSTNLNQWMLIVETQRKAFRKYQVIPLSFVIAIGLTCNVLVISSAIQRRIRTKYPMNPFILSLALADLGVIIYFIPIHFIEYTVGLRVSDWTCKYIIPIRETFVTVSLFTVADLSMLRFWQIRSSCIFSRRFIYCVISVTWIFAYLVISMPISFVIRHTPAMTCDHVWKNDAYRTIHIAFINTIQLLPLLVTTICYASIIRRVRKSNEEHRNVVTNELSQNGNELGILLLLIIAAWWSFAPFLVYSFLSIFGVEINFPFKAWSAVSVFLTSSSAINPVLVLLMYKDYRVEISNRFCKREPIIPIVSTGTRRTSALTDFNLQTLDNCKSR